MALHVDINTLLILENKTITHQGSNQYKLQAPYISVYRENKFVNMKAWIQAFS